MVIYTVDTDGVSGDYSSLAAARAALPSPLTDDYKITLSASTGVADTTSGDIDFNIDTESTYRLYIEQIDENYVLQLGDTDSIVVAGAFGRVSNITLDGIQFSKPAVTANYRLHLEISEVRDGDIIIQNCNFKDSGNSSYRGRVLRLDPRATSTATITFQNNVVWNVADAASVASTIFYSTITATQPVKIYNNTIVGGYNTFYATSTVTNWLFKNNIFKQDNVFGETVDSNSNYNSASYSGLTGANDRNSQTFLFEDEANGDFRLASGDTGAKGYGVGPDLDSDVPTTDIDGNVRSGNSCDIGAYETAGTTPGELTDITLSTLSLGSFTGQCNITGDIQGVTLAALVLGEITGETEVDGLLNGITLSGASLGTITGQCISNGQLSGLLLSPAILDKLEGQNISTGQLDGVTLSALVLGKISGEGTGNVLGEITLGTLSLGSFTGQCTVDGVLEGLDLSSLELGEMSVSEIQGILTAAIEGFVPNMDIEGFIPTLEIIGGIE